MEPLAPRKHARLSPEQRRPAHPQRAAGLATFPQNGTAAGLAGRPALRGASGAGRVGRVDLRIQERAFTPTLSRRAVFLDRLRGTSSPAGLRTGAGLLPRRDAVQNFHGAISLRDPALCLVEARQNRLERHQGLPAVSGHLARARCADQSCRSLVPGASQARGRPH